MSSFRNIALLILTLTCALSLSGQDFLSARVISPSQLPTGAGILAAGDLNGDGISDLVYTVPTAGSFGYSSFGIAFGTQTGLAISATYAQALANVSIADINGDGRPDLIGSADSGPTGRLAVYLNRGDGTFTEPVITPIPVSTGVWLPTMSIAVDDFDGNGKLDVIVTDKNWNLFFFRGNGDGTVAAGTTFRGKTYNPYRVVKVVDLNRDGKLDLVLNIVYAGFAIRLGNGDGTFQAEVDMPGTGNNSVAAADFNGDGIPDIATTAYPDAYTFVVRIFSGNGDGTFTQTNTFPYSSAIGQLLDVRDVNGDEKPDLIIDGANGFTICLGQGGGQFATPVTYSAPRWASGGAALGDFDGDGYLDIIGSINYSSDGVVYLLKGFPEGKFEGALTWNVNSRQTSIAVADLNHDQLPDIVASSSGTSVFLGKSDGAFELTSDDKPAGSQYCATSLFLQDLDGDNNIDALYVPCDSYSSVSVRKGNGDGSFANPVAGISLYHSAAGVSLGDLNRDGKPDLVGIVDGYMAVWLGAGAGTFGAKRDYYSVSGPAYGSKTLIADVNQDGVNDVLVNMSGATVTFLAGSGDAVGTLVPSAVSYPGLDFTVVDVNGDGAVDLVAISPESGSEELSIYPGDGRGGFGGRSRVPTSQTYTGIFTADLNLDGNSDLILTNGTQIAVMYGDGKGEFGPEQVMLASDVPHSVIVGDWNHDGAPDIAVANSAGGSPSPQSITLFLNRAGDNATLSLDKSPAQYGNPVTVTASVNATVLNSPIPSGTVSLSLDGVQTLQGSLANGSYSAQLGLIPAGDHVIAGSYVSDGKFLSKNFAASSLAITKAETTTNLSSSANPGLVGSTIDISVLVQPAFAGVPGGNVGLWDGPQLLGNATLNNAGRAIFSLNNLAQGTHELSAKFEGDTNFLPSNSDVFSQRMLYPTAVSVASSATSALIGTGVTFTANVSSQYGTPTGTVAFIDGSNVLGQVTTAGGTATLRVGSLPQGIHNVRVSYQGDGTFVASDSPATNVAITDFSIVASDPTLSLNAGASGTYTLNLTALSGFAGSVTLNCTGAPALAACSVSSPVHLNGGIASATVAVTTTGSNHASLPQHPGGTVMARLAATSLTLVIGVVGFSERRRQKGRTLLIVCLLAGIACGTLACGGGVSQAPSSQPPPTTPSGSASLLVTASTTAGDVTVKHSVSLTLNVR